MSPLGWQFHHLQHHCIGVSAEDIACNNVQHGQWTCDENFFQQFSQIIGWFGQMGWINCGVFPVELSAHISSLCVPKGQLNSEWIYEVIVSPKMPTKNLKDFCPGSLLEGRAEILTIFGWHFGRNDDHIN